MRFSAVTADVEALERRVLFDGATPDVSIGKGAARQVRFSDADGTAAIVRLKGKGTATLHFTGEGLAQAPAGRAVAISGTSVALSSVTATGTSGNSSVSFSASGGDGRVGVGGISADGPLKAIDGRPVVLTGNLSTGGPVRQVRLLRAENAAISLGGSAGTSSVEITEAAADCNLTAATSLRRLQLGGWGGAVRGGTIVVPSIVRAIIGGTFTGDLRTSSAGKLDFDQIQDAAMDVSGSVQSFSVTRAGDVAVNVGGDIGSVFIGSMLRTQVYAGVLPPPAGERVPTSVAQFVAPSTIRRLDMAGGWTTSDSVVAARYLGNVQIRGIPEMFEFHNFVVADHIKRLTRTVGQGKLTTFVDKNLESQVIDNPKATEVHVL